jgi:Co/Zn/Cd efflux system component
MSSCDCHIEVTDASQKGVLRKLLALNATMFLVELVVGIIGESTGVLADSLDMLADALVYSVALYAVGRCSSIKTKAAFLSGGFQLLIALGIGTDIVRRAITGSEPSSLLMFIVSIIALAVNAYCLKLISKEKEGEVHMRASYIFSKNDVIANSCVILASVIIYLTGSRWPDLIIGTIITGVVLWGGIRILVDARQQSERD